MRKHLLLISLFATAACSGSSGSGGDGGSTGSTSTALIGHIANGTGTDTAGFGGPGATQSSMNVSANTIDASGNLTSVAQVAVAAGGTYTIDVPVHAGPTVMEALDSSGKVVVSAILEDALVAGATVTVQPMTTESSVEASVLLDMVASGTSLSAIDLVGLRARIDAATALVVQAHAADMASEATADVHALGVAAMTAQVSQQASLKAAAVNATTYAAAELSAADALTLALAASDTGTVQANATFTAALAALDTQFGLDAAAAASEATNASTSARVAMAAASTSTDLTAAFDLTQAELESMASTAAITEAFTVAAAPAAVMVQLQAANTTLVTSVGAATDAAGVTTAFTTWRTSVQGTAPATDGLLATVLGATLTGSAAYTTTVGSIMDLDTTLQTSLGASAAASADSSGVIDTTKLAGLVAQAYATFDTGVTAGVTSSTLTFAGNDSALMTSVFVTSQGSF